MHAKHLILAAVIALPMPTVHGEAQEIAQPSRGLILAQRLCAECHAVQKEYSRSPNANAPRFQAIASIPRHDRDRVIGRAQYVTSFDAHIMLAADEQADLIAYILSLK